MENNNSDEKVYVTRINLKTATDHRKELIDFCLNGKNEFTDDEKAQGKAQFLAIGWSCVDFKSDDYSAFYDTVVEYVHGQNRRLNPALKIFKDARVNDLFWTRDLNGVYWICRVKNPAKAYLNRELDIGAILPVEAYEFELEVPGQIKASFNRARGGIVQRLQYPAITEYSKFVFNKLSGKNYYDINLSIANNVIENLPDFELEELVISYIQIVKGYYLLSNSIANKSTTVKIECQLISRDVNDVKKAVVQVKGPKAPALNALSFKDYENKGYYIYLYAPKVDNLEEMKNVIQITTEELQAFYKEYKAILPESITQFENLFNIGFSEKE
ncbi:ribonuclease D [Veillonella infantium]|uniref:Ribonuclease D n=1 Tax=Veillonella infantium TaxID=1911679 RepID=A0ABX5C5U3_9FIRM|nr:ribonuclease D [Veillonella infantium]PQL57992.1 ribonuclease D [Veillonella infantium]